MLIDLTEALGLFCASPDHMVPVTVDRDDGLTIFYVEGRECGMEPHEFAERLILNYPLLFAEAQLAEIVEAIQAAI